MLLSQSEPQRDPPIDAEQPKTIDSPKLLPVAGAS
jgi:hypothetical protein